MLKLPLQFVCYGITPAKMFYHFRNTDTFIVADDNIPTRSWGNSVVYGGLFLCNDFDFYSRVLDGYHLCSMSLLGRNHQRDLHHRHIINVTPIYFDTLEQLARLQYTEGQPIMAQGYFGNPQHPNILRRIIIRYKMSRRIEEGIDAPNFKELFRRNMNDRC